MAGLKDSIYHHNWWIAFLVFLFIAVALNVIRIKKNYTDLHRRVHELEYKVHEDWMHRNR